MKKSKLVLPEKIFEIEQNKPYRVLTIGLSGAEVREYDDFVLKIQPRTVKSQNEATFMKFLENRTLAPKLLAYETQDGCDYILMSKLNGKMLCDDAYLQNQRQLLEFAGNAMHALYGLPVDECPCNMSLAVKLRLAEHNVVNNLVDLDMVNPDTFGKKGRFLNPEKLLAWLYDNKPREDLSVTHGDFCLPNILVCDAQVALIDFPYGGVADRYCDIALLYRSVRDNLQGEYGGRNYGALDEKMFFDVLGVACDYEKIDYYILLDELF